MAFYPQSFPRPVLRLASILCLFLLAAGGCRNGAEVEQIPARPDLSGRPRALLEEISVAEQAVRSTPNDASAWMRLGNVYFANDFAGEARTCYQQALLGPQHRARAAYLLAHVAIGNNDVEAQKEHLEESLRLDPTYLPARLLLGRIRKKSGDAEGARAEWTKVLMVNPASREAALMLARDHMSEGRNDDAARLLKPVLEQSPHSHSALVMLAELEERRGHSAEAQELFERSRFRKDPPREDPWLEDAFRSCFNVQRLAIRFEDFAKAGMEDEAVATLRQIEAIDPNHRLVHHMRGVLASNQGRYSDAVREYEAALAAGVADPELLIAVGVSRMQSGDSDGARARLEEALKIVPEHVVANNALAKIHWEAGRRAEAVEFLARVRRASASDVPSRAMLGEYFLSKADPESALAPLTEAFALAPDAPELAELLALAHVRVGNEHARRGRMDDALAAYDHAISVRPDSVEAHANKVQILMRLQRRGEAEGALKAWIDSQPESPAAWMLLGDLQHATGESRLSRESWTRASDLLAAHPDPKLREALMARLSR